MLTSEEQDVVVAAMRKYPVGVDAGSWGSSDDFFNDAGDPDCLMNVIDLEQFKKQIFGE